MAILQNEIKPDQKITFPNDLGLLNKARKKNEKIIDGLYEARTEKK